MPTITLMRHGLPDAPAGKWLTAHGFADWVRRYDAAPVTPACPPPAAALEQARPCGAVVCSDLPRSLSSAALLGVRPAQATALLREAALPTPAARWPLLRLPASAWAALARLAWLAGIACGRESPVQARLRAAQAALWLAAQAARHGSVLLVGHGVFNRLLAHQLQRQGWQRQGAHAHRHWSFCVLRHDSPAPCAAQSQGVTVSPA